MDCGQRIGREAAGDELAALKGDFEVTPQQGLGRSGAQAYEDLGLEQAKLFFQPGDAGGDLPSIGFLVQPTLSPGLPLEVLDHVCDVGVMAVDAGGLQGIVQ